MLTLLICEKQRYYTELHPTYESALKVAERERAPTVMIYDPEEGLLYRKTRPV